MSGPLLRFEDGKISIGGKDLFASSANLSISPALEVERVYGEYDAKIAGSKTNFVNFAPTQGLRGQLEVSFFISAEQFAKGGNPNTINRMFDIAAGMSEAPINDNVVGRYSFNNMYLKSFAFDMSPFQIVRATASYDIYGSVERVIDRRFSKSEVNFAHSLKSFGSLVASDSYQYDYEGYVLYHQDLNDYYENPANTWDYDQDGFSEPVQSQTKEKFGESYWTLAGSVEGREAPPKVSTLNEFEIASLKYNILVNRKVHDHIRANENTSVNTTANGTSPVRVTVESIEKEMTIESSEMLENINAYGDKQDSTTPFGLSDSRIDAFLLSMQGERIARFSANGKIQTQSMNIAEGQYAKGNVTIKEIIK